MKVSESVYLPSFSPDTLKLPPASVMPPPANLSLPCSVTLILTKPRGSDFCRSNILPFTMPCAHPVYAHRQSRKNIIKRFIYVYKTD